MPAGGGVAQRVAGDVGPAGVVGDAGEVHEVDHGRRGAALGDLVEGGGEDARSVTEAAVGRRHRQAEQPGLAEGLDGLGREAAAHVDVVGVGGNRLVGDGADAVDDGGLGGVEAVHRPLLGHGCPPARRPAGVHGVGQRRTVSATLRSSVACSGERSRAASQSRVRPSPSRSVER